VKKYREEYDQIVGLYGPFSVDVFNGENSSSVRMYSRENRRMRIQKMWDNKSSESVSPNVISIFDENHKTLL